MKKKKDRWMFRIVRDCKASDLKANREYAPENFINTKYLEYLQEKQCNLCFYCECFMDWIERRKTKTGLTCERRNNNLPHEKNNCVLCCKSCNSKKYSYEKGLMKRHFSKWYNRTFNIVPPRTNRRCSYIT
jgi:hypothetical protein